MSVMPIIGIRRVACADIAACCARAASGHAAAAPPSSVMNSRPLMSNFRLLPPSRRAAGRVTAASACLKGTGKSLGHPVNEYFSAFQFNSLGFAMAAAKHAIATLSQQQMTANEMGTPP
jgi:hypothetical protein